MTTPHDAERRARESVLARIGDWAVQDTQHAATQSRMTEEEALDAYRAAVYARAMRDAVNVVGQSREVFVPMSMRVGRNDERYIDATELLTRLAALPATPSREARDEAK